MQVRYTSYVRTLQVVKILFPRSQGSQNYKKNHMECFFQFLMLNISSIKELLHKPSESESWNSTRKPGKLKRNISWALSYKVLPPEFKKCEKSPFLGVLLGPGNQSGIQWFLMILCISESFRLYLLVKNSLNFKLGSQSHHYAQLGNALQKHFFAYSTLIMGTLKSF